MLAINGVPLDDPTKPYVIAEAAGSHCQNYATAQALVRAAAEAGANAIKFQTFVADEIAADVPLPFGYSQEHDAWCKRQGARTLRELMSKGGLPREWHKSLKHLAESVGIAFLSTPFSVDAARFLVEEVGVPALKIASGDLTFTPLLEYAASTGLPILLSTGMATPEEIATALRTIDPAEYCEQVCLFHCVSAYPCPVTAVNLRALDYMSVAYYCSAYGWSDHTTSVEVVPALAVACGATCIEKHLKLEDDTTSVDADHSLTPSQFSQMVETVRQVPQILGTAKKEPHVLEQHDRAWSRRSPEDWLRPTGRARAGAWV